MLREAATSVLGQTCRDLELVIVLNAASDAAKAAAVGIVRSDPRVRLVELKRGNVSAARNAGIKAARGEWIAFLDDDDTWFPNKIDRQLEASNRTEATFVNCDFIESDGTGAENLVHIWPPDDLTFAEGFILSNYGAAGSSGAMVRTSVVRSLHGFDESMHGCEDWDLWRRISHHNKIHFIAEPLVKINRHPANRSLFISMVRWELRHRLKMLLDTPKPLRHMLARSHREMFWREAANLYALADRTSGGRIRTIYRSIVPR